MICDLVGDKKFVSLAKSLLRNKKVSTLIFKNNGLTACSSGKLLKTLLERKDCAIERERIYGNNSGLLSFADVPFERPKQLVELVLKPTTVDDNWLARFSASGLQVGTLLLGTDGITQVGCAQLPNLVHRCGIKLPFEWALALYPRDMQWTLRFGGRTDSLASVTRLRMKGRVGRHFYQEARVSDWSSSHAPDVFLLPFQPSA